MNLDWKYLLNHYDKLKYYLIDSLLYTKRGRKWKAKQKNKEETK